ncbi:hypothetical protein ACSRUE_42080 [Sorangium sp. KYC3313]|uniref:hypothetical protein n=1 Tax=Sorangium sp. KYC3313 TaxID=3449740 RepID=UPI003F88B8F0
MARAFQASREVEKSKLFSLDAGSSGQEDAFVQRRFMSSSHHRSRANRPFDPGRAIDRLTRWQARADRDG